MTAGTPSSAQAVGRRVPSSFQFLLALYIILTGDLPTVVQAFAFGIDDAVHAEFAAAMLSSFALDLLLLAPVIILARHPLGILHPLVLAIVMWPLLSRVPSVIEQLGGWGPVLLGLPVETPYFKGLGYQSGSQIWTAIAKHNALEIVAVCSAYLGFALWNGRREVARIRSLPIDPLAARAVLFGLILASAFALAFFIYLRGGLVDHLFDLGRGRFRSLAGKGMWMVAADLGAIALLLWIAVRPTDAKSFLFIPALGIVILCQFTSDGSRAAALAVVMLAGLVWALRMQRIPWRLGILLVPLLFLSLGLMNAIRTSSWTGHTAGEAISNTGTFEAIERIERELRIRRSLSSQIPIVEKGFEASDGPLFGKSYLAAVFAAIPRSMWEDKPRGPGSLYAQMFLGEAREGQAIPVSSTVEAYWNFGLPGLLVLSALYGLLLRLVYQFYWRRYPDPFAICFYALFVTTFRLSTDSLVLFQQQFMLLLFAYFAVRFFVPQARPRVDDIYFRRLAAETQARPAGASGLRPAGS